jgi:hypothetical protein
MSERRARAQVVRGGRVVGTVPLPPGTKQESPPRPRVPEGTVPMHETPRPDGLVVDTSIESYSHKRWSPRWPFRNRWPEVHAFDDEVTRLEQKQAGTNAERAGLQEQLRTAEQQDREALAAWVADTSGERPLPTAPGIEQRIGELEHERDALTIAMHRVLDHKSAYVQKHRGRLILEARKARSDAVEQLGASIAAIEKARAEVVSCVEAERWAGEFPGQEADAGPLRLALLKGGRNTSAIPALTTLVVASTVFEALREDAAWMDRVLDDEQLKQVEVDPHDQAIWEQTEEGRKAINLANRRIAAGLAPRNTQAAGWEP